VELAGRLGVSQPTASQTINQGKDIVKDMGPHVPGMIHVNISMPVPEMPQTHYRSSCSIVFIEPSWSRLFDIEKLNLSPVSRLVFI